MILLSSALAAVGTSTDATTLDWGDCGTLESGTLEDPNTASTAYGTVELFQETSSTLHRTSTEPEAEPALGMAGDRRR